MLARNQVIPQKLADRIAQAIRMRNTIVHHYPGVNLQIVYDVIQHNLGDIVDFCAATMACLD